jgi:hypothetical protein
MFVDSLLEKAEKIGEKVGISINTKAKKIIKIVVISLSVIFIGGLILMATLFRTSLGKKKE